MKKTFWSLAALMLMAALMMTSCSNDLDEVAPIEEVKSNVVTITIAPPAAEPENRVAMGGEKGLNIAGWEIGDVVTLYKAIEGTPAGYWAGTPARITGTGIAFTCTNASAGTFSGTLPAGENIDDYNLAIFGGTAEYFEIKDEWGNIEYANIKITPTTWSSTNLKDVVMMGAVKEGESFTMQVINNVMKIENQSGADVTVAWYGFDWGPEENLYFELASVLGPGRDETWKWHGYRINFQEHTEASSVSNFTLVNNAVNYVNFPMICSDYSSHDMIGLYMSDGTAVVPMKSVEYRVSDDWSKTYCGHLLNAGTFGGNAAPATTGTAEATGISNVGWVQLWAGGPKFAEYNLGASSATELGTQISFAEATKTGDDYVWGANWCTPSKDAMEHLMTAAMGQTDDKVTCAYTEKNGVYGIEFTGKTSGYESNSVFFPALRGDSFYGFANYWSGTASGDRGWFMSLRSDWYSTWEEGGQLFDFLVRPVLKE